MRSPQHIINSHEQLYNLIKNCVEKAGGEISSLLITKEGNKYYVFYDAIERKSILELLKDLDKVRDE